MSAPSSKRNDVAYFMVQQLVGSSKWQHFVWTALLLTAFGVVVNSLSNLFQALATWMGWWTWPEDLLIVFVFVMIVWWLRHHASQHEQDYAPQVISDSKPGEVRAIILYLSPPGTRGEVDDRATIQGILNGIQSGDTQSNRLSNPDFINRDDIKKLTWRMPLGAIDHHKNRLTHVVVIASADREGGNLANSRGTIHDMPLFREFLEAVGTSGPGQACPFRVLDVAQLLESCSDKSLQATAARFSRGVDFEDVSMLGEATLLSFSALRELRITAIETVVDVTGGQKPPTIAGTLVSQAEGRRIQYVSTNGYKVMTFDITYAI